MLYTVKGYVEFESEKKGKRILASELEQTGYAGQSDGVVNEYAVQAHEPFLNER